MRIASLCPSLTELVFDLGRGDELVAVTRFCIHPAAGVAGLEKVGGTKDPDVVRLVELAPDVVLVNEEENRREDAEALAAAGLRVVNTFPKDAPATAEMVRLVGRAVAAEEAAEVIAQDIEARHERVTTAATVRRAEGAAHVRFAYLIWRKPWMAASGDTYASALLEAAGGVNALGPRTPRYFELAATELRDAAPDRVLLSSEPFPFTARHADELAVASGLPRERFFLVDGEALSWHGSRTPLGVDYAEQVLHTAAPPELVPR